MSHLQFFWYLYCFRQGFMRVTLRNKKNIGLIWFMSISSSDFWLLCCTNTAWWSKKEKLFPIVQNNLKLCQNWGRHTEDPRLEYFESIFVNFQNISARFRLYNNHLTPQGVASTSTILLWPNYLVFSLVKLASPLSFLASLYLATLEASFALSSLLLLISFHSYCQAATESFLD